MPNTTTKNRFFLSRAPVRCEETYPLNAVGIEAGAERIDQLLEQLQMERQNRIRIRFSFEESLLRLRERFGEKAEFTVKVDSRLRGPYLQVALEGDIFNPLSKTASELEDWSGSLLTAVGLSPLYTYSGGKNILRLNLPRKGMNAALRLLIALVIGIGAGLALRCGLAPETQSVLVERFLMPVYDFWVRMLTVLSGPVIFLMVCTSVLNTQTIEEEGGSSGRVFLRYFVISMLAALLAVLASGFFSLEPLLWGSTLGINAADYWDALLKVMPDNIISPFVQTNTPQLLLLAFLLGRGITALGARAEGLNRLVRQCDAVGLMMTEAVSRLVALFAAVLLCMEIISGSMVTFSGMWGVLVLAVVVSGAALLLVAAVVARREGVRLRVLLKKLGPAFVTAVRSGSLDAGYGRMEQACITKLGVERHFATVSLPYGLVLLMPVNVVGTLMFTVFAALRYNVELSAGWLIIAMVLSVVLFVATPPVPGANLLAYIMIFAELHIPSLALIDAMIFDILFGIFASAANESLLQMELIIQADRLGLLDLDRLRKE